MGPGVPFQRRLSCVDRHLRPLIVHPEQAQAEIDAERQPEPGGDDRESGSTEPKSDSETKKPSPDVSGAPDPRTFYSQFSLDPVRAIRQLEDILRNVVEHLNSAPGADVTLTLEINASADGFNDKVRRVVTKNGNQLGAKGHEFE
jgi:hypothetical protein